jgi:hypothetical protein
MIDPATITTADDEAAQFLRKSGVLRQLQQQALEVNLRQAAHGQGSEILHISHRHQPAVEFSVLMGDLQEHKDPVLLRSKVCRLLWAASVRVSVSNVFARSHRALVRVACVPEWD